jgi:glutamyl-tRNA(Gln) amidotransferase subunit E
LKGVPKEVRRALPDATTTYMRPLPGAARMYPETDCTPIPLTQELLEEARSMLPEPPEAVRERMVKEYGLSHELASRLPGSGYLKIFEETLSKYRGLSPTLVASTLLQTLPSLRREGFPVEDLTPDHLHKVFEALHGGRIVKEALPEILGKVAENPSTLEELLKGEGLSKEEVAKIIAGIVDENIHLVREKGERAAQALMGLIMKRLRGKYDGAEIHRILQDTIKKQL